MGISDDTGAVYVELVPASDSLDLSKSHCIVCLYSLIHTNLHSHELYSNAVRLICHLNLLKMHNIFKS